MIIPQVGICPIRKQNVYRFPVACGGYADMQRRIAICVLGVYIRAVLQQQFNGTNIAGSGGVVQGCRAGSVLYVDIGLFPNQKRNKPFVTLACGKMQRS